MLILIGLPGSGKTSAGRHVARHFSCDFVDADHVVEEALGMRIKDFFAQSGEAAFRDAETLALRTIVQRRGACVVSTGGGAVLRAENRELLRAAGTVIYLYASPHAIYSRLRHDTQRPLLQVDDPKAKIQALFEERDALYRATAHHIINTGNCSLYALVQKIVRRIKVSDSAASD